MDILIDDKGRNIRVLRIFILLMLLGVVLYYLGSRYQLFLPCLFHEVTGWYCPGCGISRMSVSLVQLDFAAAWGYNPAVLVALPLLIYYTADMTFRYVKGKRPSTGKLHNIILYLLIGYFLVFGILRNLPAFQWMAP